MGTKSDEMSSAPPSPAAIDNAENQKAHLKSEIRATRDDMSQTVGQIEQKLKPERLKNEAIERFEEVKERIKAELREEFSDVKEKVRHEFHDAKEAVRGATIGKVEDMVHSARDTVNDAGSSIIQTMKANPIPAALFGLSLVWLYTNRRGSEHRGWRAVGQHQGATPRSSTRSFGGRQEDHNDYRGSDHNGWRSEVKNGVEAVGDAVHRTQEKAGHMAEQVQQKAGEWAHDVGETAGRLATQTSERVGHIADEAVREARQVEAYMARTMRENPVALGAVALAVGAAVGLAIPRTHVEDDLMGETSDHLREQAGELAHGAVTKAQQAADQMTDKIGESSSSSPST